MLNGPKHHRGNPVRPAGRLPGYYLTTVLVFWLPIAALAAFSWSRLSRLDKKSFWWTNALLLVLTSIMEKIYRTTRIWTFSQDVDPLLGPKLWGEPVEEFIFWLGATPFMLLVYLTARALRRGEARA